MNAELKPQIVEQNTQAESLPKDLDGLPQEVIDLYNELPKEVQHKIFDIDTEGQSTKLHLRDIIVSLSEHDREMLLDKYMYNLFVVGEYRKVFKESFEEDKLGQEVKRLLDLLWKNRENEKGDDVEIFNQGLYEKLLGQYVEIKERINIQKAEIERLDSIPRKSNRGKQFERVLDAQRELRKIQEKLKEFNQRYNNSSHDRLLGKDIAGRMKSENDWTRGVGAVIATMDAEEFAVAVEEQLDEVFPTKKRLTIYDKDVDKIRDEFGNVVQQWSQKHANDEVLLNKASDSDDKRQKKMIDYFLNLVDNYKTGIKQGRAQKDMVYTVRQMEISLNLLKG